MRLCGRENGEIRVYIQSLKNSVLSRNKADIPHFTIYPLSVTTTCLSAVELFLIPLYLGYYFTFNHGLKINIS